MPAQVENLHLRCGRGDLQNGKADRDLVVDPVAIGGEDWWIYREVINEPAAASQFGQEHDIGATGHGLHRLPQTRSLVGAEVKGEEGGVLQEAGSKADFERVGGDHLWQGDEERVASRFHRHGIARCCPRAHLHASLEINRPRQGKAQEVEAAVGGQCTRRQGVGETGGLVGVRLARLDAPQSLLHQSLLKLDR